MNRTAMRVSIVGAAAALCCIGSVAARPDLYQNGPYVTATSGGAGGAPLSVLQDSLGLQTFGFQCQGISLQWRAADDFTVTGAAGWSVSSIAFYAFQSGSGTASPTILSANLRIWSGRPGDPGSVVVFGDTTLNRLASVTWTGAYRVSETDLLSENRPVWAVEVAVSPALQLPPGTYWLDWQATGTLSSGPFVVPVTVLGQTGAAGANARQYSGASGPWINARDSGTSVQQELAFVVRGTGGGPAPCYPNCDSSTAPPCLNVLDFSCFLNKFAAADTYANCDGSTTPPTLNVLDFSCFLNRFAAGCSGC